ncbi:hypothetical protein JL720_16540 [Aureococcus anophagefferens]|nr:hypothetical protein JL720_16540 [Aureococcus anophagefferens]
MSQLRVVLWRHALVRSRTTWSSSALHPALSLCLAAAIYRTAQLASEGWLELALLPLGALMPTAERVVALAAERSSGLVDVLRVMGLRGGVYELGWAADACGVGAAVTADVGALSGASGSSPGGGAGRGPAPRLLGRERRAVLPVGGARRVAAGRGAGRARGAVPPVRVRPPPSRRRPSRRAAWFVVLDEPSAGLDALARRALWDALRRAKAGRCVLLTTHHLDEAAVLGDAIGIAVRGAFVAKGGAAELRRTYGSGYEVVARKTARFDDGGWRAVVGDGGGADLQRRVRGAASIGLAARRAAPAVASSKPAVPAFSFAANRALSTKEEAPSSGPPQTYADYSHDALLMLSEAAATSLWLTRFPYRVGIASALIAGFGSIPMCFDLHTTLWFNEGYVATGVPGQGPRGVARGRLLVLELDGAPLGQASFFLLCLQYSRDQMKNIGMKPYGWLKERRARLVDQFPTYNKIIVADFSRSLMMR